MSYELRVNTLISYLLSLISPFVYYVYLGTADSSAQLVHRAQMIVGRKTKYSYLVYLAD